MNVTVDELMIPNVLTVEGDETIGSARAKMRQHEVHALPVVDADHHALGIITANDLLEDLPDDTLIGRIVDAKVYTIPRYDSVHIAARVMRNHKIHHLVVTEEKKVVGILSSFDLLKLVEEHRFAIKNPPGESKRKSNSRA